jgi:hypothetical protein
MRGRTVAVVVGGVLAIASLIGGLQLTGQPSTTDDVAAGPGQPFATDGVTTGSGQIGKASNWPRPYDPAQPLDFSGVAGVSEAQEQRAVSLVTRTLEAASQWRDFDATVAAGWGSFGDAPAGYEHVINNNLLDDDFFLDPKYPESLVYRVVGTSRELVAVMFLARGSQRLDDSVLLEYGGRLMEWHNHADLCLRFVDGDPVGKIAGFVGDDGKCQFPGALPALEANSGHAMVHVWVVPHLCGPFAAMEGAARGTALTPTNERVDICS